MAIDGACIPPPSLISPWSHLYLVAVHFSDISVLLRTASVEFGY